MPKLRKPLFVKLQDQAHPASMHANEGKRTDRIEAWREALEADTDRTNETFYGNGGYQTQASAKEDIAAPQGTEDASSRAHSPQSIEPTPAARLKKRAKSYRLDDLDGISPASAQPRMRIRSSNAHRTGSFSLTEEDEAVLDPVHDLRVPVKLMAVAAVPLFLAPYHTLQLMLTIMVLYEEFPVWMPSWTGLIAMVSPMELKARFEITMFLALMVWLWKLDWESPWRRVLQ